jgi:ribosomal protein S25
MLKVRKFNFDLFDASVELSFKGVSRNDLRKILDFLDDIEANGTMIDNQEPETVREVEPLAKEEVFVDENENKIPEPKPKRHRTDWEESTKRLMEFIKTNGKCSRYEIIAKMNISNKLAQKILRNLEMENKLKVTTTGQFGTKIYEIPNKKEPHKKKEEPEPEFKMDILRGMLWDALKSTQKSVTKKEMIQSDVFPKEEDAEIFLNEMENNLDFRNKVEKSTGGLFIATVRMSNPEDDGIIITGVEELNDD